MTLPLSEIKVKNQVCIELIENEDLLIKLMELGVMQGSKLTIQNKAPFNGPISILVNSNRIIIRKKEAESILVKTA